MNMLGIQLTLYLIEQKTSWYHHIIYEIFIERFLKNLNKSSGNYNILQDYIRNLKLKNFFFLMSYLNK